jgi:hypothetical protein
MSSRVEILPGRGSVIRHGELTIWAGPGVSSELISFLRQSARNVANSATSGRQVADHIAAILTSRDPERSAPFAVIGPAEAGWAILLHGPVQAWDGNQWLAPTPDPGWLRTVIDPSPAVSVGPAGSPAPRLVLASPYNLVAGMVPGGGVIVLPGAGEPEPAPTGQDRAEQAPRPTPEPAASVAVPRPSEQLRDDRPGTDQPWGEQPGGAAPQTEAPQEHAAGAIGPIVDLRHRSGRGLAPLPSGAAPAPKDRPEVGGIRCPRHHFNRPGSTTCAVCRTEIPPGQPQVPGPRPTLGVLLADDGTVLRVSRDLLLGSQPKVDGVDEPALQPVTLTGAPGLAPAHAELRVHGWVLRAIDRGSAEGTHVWVAGSSDWVKLAPYSPIDIPPGSHISMAQRVLTYLSPWR